MRQDKFILNGKVPEACGDLMRWAMWMETGKRHVADSEVGVVRVSTVFLGLNHNWSPSGPPILFETMCFAQQSLDHLPFCRYATWDEAVAGHAAVCAEVQTLVDSHAKRTRAILARVMKQKNRKSRQSMELKKFK